MTDLDRGLERRLSRRGLLRVMALGGSAALLAACAPAAPASPTAAPATPAERKPADSKPTAEAKVAEKPTAAPAAKPAEKAAPAAAKGAAEIKIALASEPNSFDPHLTVGRNTQIFIADVFDGLSARDDK